MDQNKPSEFEKAAAGENRGGFLGELWGFLKTNKKWWLLPILVTFILLALLILISTTGVAPFIYTLF
jgi:drug/metabolite transporter superfamily protein YnfA